MSTPRLPGSPRTALVREPGPRVSEMVHALLDAGCTVSVASDDPGPELRDLHGRGLVALVAADAETGADLVVRDRTHEPRPTAASSPSPASGLPGMGEVVLVGGGPGAADLITVAGLQELRQADVVVHDRLAPIGLLDQTPEHCLLVPVGKIPRGDFTPQERINELLVGHALEGRRVVRLKGGDSFVFGRGGEEWLACTEAGVPVRVVPGVTSAVAAPALAGLPVTHREVTSGFVVVSGHVGPDDERNAVDWQALADAGLTIVLLMGVATLPAIAERLLACGMPPETPAAVVADAGMPSQRSVRAPLPQIAARAAAEGVGAPAVAVIGRVAAVLPEDRPAASSATAREEAVATPGHPTPSGG